MRNMKCIFDNRFVLAFLDEKMNPFRPDVDYKNNPLSFVLFFVKKQMDVKLPNEMIHDLTEQFSKSITPWNVGESNVNAAERNYEKVMKREEKEKEKQQKGLKKKKVEEKKKSAAKGKGGKSGKNGAPPEKKQKIEKKEENKKDEKKKKKNRRPGKKEREKKVKVKVH